MRSHRYHTEVIFLVVDVVDIYVVGLSFAAVNIGFSLVDKV